MDFKQEMTQALERLRALAKSEPKASEFLSTIEAEEQTETRANLDRMISQRVIRAI